MHHATSWLFAWISPREAVSVAVLILVPFVQTLTGAMMWMLVAQSLGSHREPAVDLNRWGRIAFASLLSLTVFGAAGRWLGMPQASVAIESSLWPAWLGFGTGIAALSVVSWLNSSRFQSRFKVRDRCLAGALAGLMAIASWALIVSFEIAPGSWLEARTLRLAVQPPALLPIVVVHIVSTISLGAAVAHLHKSSSHWPGSPARSPARSRMIATTSAAVGGVMLVSAPWWLPAEVVPDATRSTLEQGAWSNRWTIVALFAWASYGMAAYLGERAAERVIDRRAMLLFAALAAVSVQGTWLSYRGPWAVRGWIYANGAEVMTVRTTRTSARLENPEDGGAVFAEQCATCHAPFGPLSGWRNRQGCDAKELRLRLEALRQSDRIGHPDRERMPPLLGSDEEVDALYRWIRRTGNCE